MPRTDSQDVDSARKAFQSRFDQPATLVASAPGRVNLIGEHTDYNEGFVLPMAIERRTIICAAPHETGPSRIYSEALDLEVAADFSVPLSPIAGNQPERFANYILGVVQQFIERGHPSPNLDLLIHSNVPLGSGLASSAAMEVAMATLLEQFLGLQLDPLEKARMCQQAEHTFANTPCGIMDQLIACKAQPDHALLIDCRDLQSHHIPLPVKSEAAWLIVDTGVKHELASGEYAERRATCEEVVGILDLPSLRVATLGMLEEEQLTEIQRKRAAHVITENTRTLLAAEALNASDLVTFGDLMFASHDSLRDLYVVSCPELDGIVETAREMKGEGVYGARMTGGGFGGCVIVLCHPAHCERVVQGITEAYQTRFGPSVKVFETGAGAGAEIHGQPGASS